MIHVGQLRKHGKMYHQVSLRMIGSILQTCGAHLNGRYKQMLHILEDNEGKSQVIFLYVSFSSSTLS